MILLKVRSLHFSWDRHKYAIVLLSRFRITSSCQDKTNGGFAILISQLPICVFSQDLISCSQPIDLDDHLIKNMKNPANKFDTVNKAYAYRIKYITNTGIIPNIAMTDHILFKFLPAKAFASGKIKICEMWVERLADEWIATSGPMFATTWLSHVFPRSVPYDILLWFPASVWTRNIRLDYVELP